MDSIIGILLAALSLICIGAYSVFLKRVVSKIGEYACAFYSTLIAALVLAALAVFTTRLVMPSDLVVAAIVIGGLVGTFAFYLFYKALHGGTVSVVVPVVATYVVWSSIISCLIFKTAFGLYQIIGTIVCLVALVMIAMEKPSFPKQFDEEHIINYLKSDMWSKGAGLALVVSFCFTIVKVAARYGTDEIGTHRTLLYIAVLVLFFLLLAFLGRSAKDLVKLPLKGERKYLGIGVLLLGAGTALFYFAISYQQLNIVAPIVSAFPIVAALSAAKFLKEKLKRYQYVGIVLLTIGIILISL
jgi:drug/metabolite transporter (DMT)-like permease